MKRTLFIGFLCAALVVAFAMPSLSAAPAAPKDGEIKALDGMTATKAPVKFSHANHAAKAKAECKDCHHKLEKDPKNYKCGSAGCHDSGDAKDKTSDKSFYMAYHKATAASSCLGCHKAKTKGPVKCDDCHPKAAK